MDGVSEFEITQVQLEGIRKVFEAFEDKGEKGKMKRASLHEALKCLGLQSDLSDPPGDVLEFKGFTNFATKLLENELRNQEITESFELFDRDGDGKINAKDLLEVKPKDFYYRFTMEEAISIIRIVDEDEDGYITLAVSFSIIFSITHTFLLHCHS